MSYHNLKKPSYEASRGRKPPEGMSNFSDQNLAARSLYQSLVPTYSTIISTLILNRLVFPDETYKSRIAPRLATLSERPQPTASPKNQTAPRPKSPRSSQGLMMKTRLPCRPVSGFRMLRESRERERERERGEREREREREFHSWCSAVAELEGGFFPRCDETPRVPFLAKPFLHAVCPLVLQ